jgi:cell cycle checkpoint protein
MACADKDPGSAFLERKLFTTYTFNAPPPTQRQIADSDDESEAPDDTSTNPTFQISLPSLLETLQIFGLTDPNNNKPPWARDNATSTAFANNVLGMNNLCRISYDSPGAPLSIVLTEATIRTTSNLTTYEPDYADEIPFDRKHLAFKTIMRGSWLYDAVSELASTNPERLTLFARMAHNKPYFALSASGPLGSARVEFNNKSSSNIRPPQPTSSIASTPGESPPEHLLETFQMGDPEDTLRLSYNFKLVQKAHRAMSQAVKVSIRCDDQGVLNLQFMIEVEPGERSFVEYTLVPLVEEEGEEADESGILGNGMVSDAEDELYE